MSIFFVELKSITAVITLHDCMVIEICDIKKMGSYEFSQNKKIVTDGIP